MVTLYGFCKGFGKAETLESDGLGSNSDRTFGPLSGAWKTAFVDLKKTSINKVKIAFYFINRRHFFYFINRRLGLFLLYYGRRTTD